MNIGGNFNAANTRAEGLHHRHPAVKMQSWFAGAPVTKISTISIVLLYFLAESSKFHESLALDMDKMLADGELWRLITCHATFTTFGEVLFGSFVLCPLLRSFEREMGSRKFSTFLFISCCMGVTWEILLSGFLLPSTTDSLGAIRSSGPYTILGSTLYLFHRYTPRLHPRIVSILGFELSEKAFTYFLALQVIGSHGYYTVIPTLCGSLAGFLYCSRALPISKWEFPDLVYRCSYSIASPFVESHPSALTFLYDMGRGANRPRGVVVPNTAASLNPSSRGVHPDRRNSRSPLVPPPSSQNESLPLSPPSEAAIETLMAMGFDHESVVRTLQQCDNNVEVAADRLLGG